MPIDCQKRVPELREETVAHRRYFHTNAEVELEPQGEAIRPGGPPQQELFC